MTPVVLPVPIPVPGAAPVALIPEDAPFTPAQRAWLNGFFLGLLSRPPAAQPAAAPALAVSVLHASQTGTAEGLARKLSKAAKGQGHDASRAALGTLSLDDLARCRLVLVIASTQGDGEAPDSAAALALQLEAAQGSPLAGLRYAVLALGDSSYSKFCRFGAWLDERLAALGGMRLIERIDVDGAADAPFKAWQEALWPLLQREAPANAPTAVPAVTDDDAADEEDTVWTRDHPFAAPLRANTTLTRAGSDKETRHVVLSLAGSGMTYEPGDALGIWPRNAPGLVQALIARCGLAADAPVQIDAIDMPLAEVLAACRELGKLNVATARKFAALAGDAELQRLLEPEHATALAQFLHGRDALDLAARADGRRWSAQELADWLPALAPRLYSISSSLAAFPDEVHLTVGVVRYDHLGRRRGGVASTFLADYACAGEPLPIYVHRNTRFRMPEDAGTPMIMIGPGTGIAPFRAFLHERRARGWTGRTWLFFGARHAASDYLYRDELEALRRANCLTRLTTAFSRDQAEKIYVQHRMLEAGAELWAWMQEGAILYVCGDAAHMAKDVDAALQAIFAKHGGMSAAAAQLELRHLGAVGRYVRDVY